MHVLDWILSAEVNPEHDLKKGRIFVDGVGDDVSIEERGKRFQLIVSFVTSGGYLVHILLRSLSRCLLDMSNSCTASPNTTTHLR